MWTNKLRYMIKELIKEKYTEGRIADHAGVSQPTINRIKNGIQEPLYETGKEIEALHKSVIGKPPKKRRWISPLTPLMAW